MLFNSVEYLLLFLPLSLVVFQLLASTSGTERQINWLVIASLFFYASWKPVYLLLIISSIVVNFTLGKKLASDHSQGSRKWLVLGVCFNLGLLGYFKYTKKKFGVGKRIFKMSPLHHHYQLLGYAEPKIVQRFMIVGIMLAIFAVITLKLR